MLNNELIPGVFINLTFRRRRPPPPHAFFWYKKIRVGKFTFSDGDLKPCRAILTFTELNLKWTYNIFYQNILFVVTFQNEGYRLFLL